MNDTKGPPAIETRNVRKRYLDGASRITAVDDVSVRIRSQALTVIAGPSGCGKTTLLQLMGGMLVPTAGDVALLGTSVAHLRDHHRTQLRRSTVGFVFQEFSLIAEMSVLENVLIPWVPDGGATQPIRQAALGLLDRVGLAGKAAQRAGSLSGGERQRVAIVRALVRNPPILLMDEPTAHIDAPRVSELLGLLASLRDEGKTIVCTTHDPRLIGHAAVDETISMVEGRIQPHIAAQPQSSGPPHDPGTN